MKRFLLMIVPLLLLGLVPTGCTSISEDAVDGAKAIFNEWVDEVVAGVKEEVVTNRTREHGVILEKLRVLQNDVNAHKAHFEQIHGPPTPSP